MFNNNRNQLLSPLQYESSSLTTTTTTTTNGSNMSNSTCNKLNYTGNMSHHQQLLQMDMNSHNNSAFFPSVFGATHSNTVNNYKDIYTMYPFYYYPRHFNQNDFGRRNRNLTYTPSSATTLYTSSPIHVPKFTLMNFEGNNTNNSNNNNYQLQQNESLFMKESNTVTKHSSLSQNFQKNLRIQVILEAETAVTKKDEESITYLNRGQVYSIQLKDNLSKNQVITSTISISFHLSKHRAITDTFWKYWLSQQSEPNPRLIEIDNTNSIGVTNVNLSNFDKIIFNWNGEVGAKIMIRFKFLSTDFTKTKGVKGIPLRVLMKSQFQEINTEMINNHETSFCTIKLFRDKGAERKTKDDSKHRTKLLEKIYGKSDDSVAAVMYTLSTPHTLFKEALELSSNLSESNRRLSHIKTRLHARAMTTPNPSSLFHTNNITHPSWSLPVHTTAKNLSPQCMTVVDSPKSAVELIKTSSITTSHPIYSDIINGNGDDILSKYVFPHVENGSCQEQQQQQQQQQEIPIAFNNSDVDIATDISKEISPLLDTIHTNYSQLNNNNKNDSDNKNDTEQAILPSPFEEAIAEIEAEQFQAAVAAVASELSPPSILLECHKSILSYKDTPYTTRLSPSIHDILLSDKLQDVSSVNAIHENILISNEPLSILQQQQHLANKETTTITTKHDSTLYYHHHHHPTTTTISQLTENTMNNNNKKRSRDDDEVYNKKRKKHSSSTKRASSTPLW